MMQELPYKINNLVYTVKNGVENDMCRFLVETAISLLLAHHVLISNTYQLIIPQISGLAVN